MVFTEALFMNVAFCRIRYHATDKSLDRLDTMLRLAVIFRVVPGAMMPLDTKTLTEVINNLPHRRSSPDD